MPFAPQNQSIRQKFIKIHRRLPCNRTKVYEEKGVYTVEMFTKRNDTLTKEIQKQQAAEADLLRKQSAHKEMKNAEAEFIPTTQHILDSYPRLSVLEKNSLWKIVMEKITIYRTPEGEFSMHIYPKLPM